MRTPALVTAPASGACRDTDEATTDRPDGTNQDTTTGDAPMGLMVRSRAALVLVLAISTLALACGGSDGERTGAPEASPPATSAPTPEPEPTTPPTPTPPPEPSATPIPTEPPTPQGPVDLQSVTTPGSEADGGGWRLDPGTYDVTRLAADVRLTVGEPITVLEHSPGLVAFGSLGTEFEGIVNLLVLIDLAGYAGVGDAVEFKGDIVGKRASFADRVEPTETVTDWLGSIPQLAIVDTGTEQLSGREVGWVDFEVVADSGGFRCPLGNTCVNTFYAAGHGYLEAGTAYRWRVWELEPGGLLAIRQGGKRDVDAYIDDLADELLRSIELP